MDRYRAYFSLAPAVLAPLPFGSVDENWTILWLLWFTVDIAINPLGPTDRRGRWIVYPVVLTALIAVGVALVQIVPDRPSGLAYPVWDDLDRAAGLKGPHAISATRSNPIIGIGAILCGLLAFLRSFEAGSDTKRARTMLTCVMVSALAYACYGIASILLDSGTILWQEKTAYRYNLTGTFVNRNTAATYFGGATIICTMFCLHKLEELCPTRFASFFHAVDWFLSKRTRPVRVYLAFATICLTATVMTGSRAGFVITFAVLSICVALSVGRVRLLARHRRRILVGALVLILLVAEILFSSVSERFTRFGIGDANRIEVYRAALVMIAAYPWFGIGLGNFEAVFPAYRTAQLMGPGVWDRAHSTWLQICVEMGLPFGCLTIGLVAWLALVLLRGLRTDTRASHLILSGLGFGLIGVVHSAIDFSLQVPGYAIVFLTVVGCALGQSCRALGRAQDRAAGRDGVREGRRTA